MRQSKRAQHLTELRQLTVEQLEGRLYEEYRALFKLRRDASLAQLENPKSVHATRKRIAQVMTVINEKHRAASEEKRGTGS